MTATTFRTIDFLTDMIVAFLTPIFLTSASDLSLARAAALESVRACAARNPTELVLIGQMIALGLATISSVSVSMAENIPINQILRLRGNAVSLHRASDKCRRALVDPVTEPQQYPLTEVEETLIAELQAKLTRPKPAPTQAAPAPAPATKPDMRPTTEPAPGPISPHSDRLLRAAWSQAFPELAPEAIDNLFNESRIEPKTGSMRAAALSTTANHLISNTSPT
jgi:hypothetical protein